MNGTNGKTTNDLKRALSWSMAHAKQVSSLISLLSGVAGAVKLFQSFRRKDPLSRLRQTRRAGIGPLGAVALLGAGVAVGTGVGIFLAPASGARTWRRIRRRFDEINGEERRPHGRSTPASPTRDMKNGAPLHHH